jgi:hypothetical protein
LEADVEKRTERPLMQRKKGEQGRIAGAEKGVGGEEERTKQQEGKE